MDALKINEINPIPGNDIPHLLQMPENFSPSDEIVVGENNYDYGESQYIKRKRAAKIVKVALTTTLLTITITAGGATILSEITGKPVTMNKASYDINEDLFTYTIDITIERQKLAVEIDNEKETVFTIGYDVTGVYTKTVQLERGHTYNIAYFSTNFIDLRNEIKDTRYTFEIK